MAPTRTPTIIRRIGSKSVVKVLSLLETLSSNCSESSCIDFSKVPLFSPASIILTIKLGIRPLDFLRASEIFFPEETDFDDSSIILLIFFLLTTFLVRSKASVIGIPEDKSRNMLLQKRGISILRRKKTLEMRGITKKRLILITTRRTIITSIG